jgi:hypothetical protein
MKTPPEQTRIFDSTGTRHNRKIHPSLVVTVPPSPSRLSTILSPSTWFRSATNKEKDAQSALKQATSHFSFTPSDNGQQQKYTAHKSDKSGARQIPSVLYSNEVKYEAKPMKQVPPKNVTKTIPDCKTDDNFLGNLSGKPVKSRVKPKTSKQLLEEYVHGAVKSSYVSKKEPTAPATADSKSKYHLDQTQQSTNTKSINMNSHSQINQKPKQHQEFRYDQTMSLSNSHSSRVNPRLVLRVEPTREGMVEDVEDVYF